MNFYEHLRKYKENLKNSKIILRKIRKNNWKFNKFSKNKFKYFEKLFRKILKMLRKFEENLFKNWENLKIFETTLQKYIRKYSVSSQ